MPASITVLVRSQQPENMFGAYTAELLRFEGLTDFRVVDLDETDEWLTDPSPMTILTRGHLRAAEREQLIDYVRQGGRLLVFRPALDFCTTLGLSPRYEVTFAPYLLPDADHPATRGIPHATIQCHWVCERYGIGAMTGGVEVLARDLFDRDTPTGYASIICTDLGQGKIALMFYDPPATVARIRFGNPELGTTKTTGFRHYPRSAELFTNHYDPERGHLPQADIHSALLANIVCYLCPRPLPRLWYYETPEERSALPMRSDDDWSTPDQFEALRTAVEDRDGHCTFYLVRDTKLPDDRTAAYRDRGHEFGYHSNPHGDEDPYFAVSETLESDAGAFRQRYGYTARTTQLHSAYWRGYMDLVPLFQRIGIKMAVTYGSYQEGFGKFVCGSSRPIKFIDERGRIHDVFQQSTILYDDASVREVMTDETDRLVGEAAKLLDECVKNHHSALGFQSHPVSFATYSSPYICGVMDHAHKRDVRVLSMDEWCEFTERRYGATVQPAASTDDRIKCEVIAGEHPGRLTVMLPAGEHAESAEACVGDEPAPSVVRSLFGYDYALTPVELSQPHERQVVSVRVN